MQKGDCDKNAVTEKVKVTDSDNEEESSELISRKVIILGDSETGKTSLLMRFDHDKYCEAGLTATVGVGYSNKVVEIEDGARIKLQIWDTAGQERFRSITRAYYRDAEGLLLVYDITNRASYDNIKNWITEVSEVAKEGVVTMVIANKSDLANAREVSEEDGLRLAKENGASFTAASAKTGENVETAFLTLAKHLHEKSTRPTKDGRPTKLLGNLQVKPKCC